MAEVSPSGLTIDDVMQMMQQNSPTVFVGGSNSSPLTVASLHSSFPPSATHLGKYARVSDLFGSVDDIMRCRYDGIAYKWIPQRPNFTGVIASTSGTVTITPLVTPPTIRITSALLGNMSIVPSSTNAFIGMKQTIIQEGALGLFTSIITGLIGANIALSPLTNSVQTIEYGSTGWFRSG